ncbi:hypothetical protein HPP92_000340 [Vanilla planifolia]|uniref:NAC domain-containing protein n=1 Tax=Vanilla planifolia TaxID=51239 RepID=A0A835SAI2_VANPL|nr:hypothetical protein HPP92_000340 [Vanilla planifolia]
MAPMETNEFPNPNPMRLPPGFRFHPTDEELVVQYLKRKALSRPLPAAIIPEIELRRISPHKLLGGFTGEKYFFNLRETKGGNRKVGGFMVGTGRGYWKPMGTEKPVMSSRGDELVGTKQILVFCRALGSQTKWVMHELRLAKNELPYIASNNLVASGKEWVACRIFAKRRESMKRRRRSRRPLSSSESSSTSCITSLSDEECSIGEEVTS